MNPSITVVAILCWIIGLMIGIMAGYLITWRYAMGIINIYKRIIEDYKSQLAELRNWLIVGRDGQT